MSEDVLRSKVTVDRHRTPSLYAEIAKVPDRYRASRLLALAAMGLVVEKMQNTGSPVVADSKQESSISIGAGEGQNGGDAGENHRPSGTHEQVVEELGMGDLFSAAHCADVA